MGTAVTAVAAVPADGSTDPHMDMDIGAGAVECVPVSAVAMPTMSIFRPGSLTTAVAAGATCISLVEDDDDDDDSRHQSVRGSASLPAENEEDPVCVQMKRELVDACNALQLPESPLDAIMDALGGPTQVAELTGRRGRLVRSRVGAKNTFSYELRGGSEDFETLNVAEANNFNAGRKLVAIISDAASTGISLHASAMAKNQRRRRHLTIELPWSADKAIQQLGRTHRSNQVSAPIYTLVTADLGGERRFSAAVSQRLQSLGAITKVTPDV